MIRRTFVLACVAAWAAGLTGCSSLGQSDAAALARERAMERNEELLRAHRERMADLEGQVAPLKTTEELLREGDRLRRAGNISKAAVSYLRAHHSDKDDLTPLRRIAYLALETEPAQARELFGELIEKSPEAADLHLGLGMAHLAAGDFDLALASILRARELDPQQPIIAESVGVIYDRLDRHEEAQQTYLEALELAKPAPRLLNNLGVSYLMTKDYEEAAESFERALARGSLDPAVRNNLGLALGLVGRYEEAHSQFSKAGTPGDAYNNLGYVLYLRGDYAGAKRAYEKALLSNDTDEQRVLHNLKVLEQSYREGLIGPAAPQG